MINLEDLRLAKAITKKNEKMFNHFFDLYFPKLYRFTMARVDGDIELSKDIVQETMSIAIKSIKQYRGEAALFTWLCQINRSQISLYFRKNKTASLTHHIEDNPEIREVFDNIQIKGSLNPDKLYENKNLAELISSTLDNLPHGYGDILELKYLEKLSVNEIAIKMNTSVVSIQSKLARARETFKTVICEMQGAKKGLKNLI